MNPSSRCKLLLALFAFVAVSYGQQKTIARVESMPNRPQPYLMRNWTAVALSYDSLVFDLGRSGQYLPLVWEQVSTVNYPGHSSFGLHSVVGPTNVSSPEAINCLPAVIGASLVGIDKRSQNGKNWVLMSEEWFNKRPAENVYLNHPVASSGDDWWYETMPNVFFYQLYDRYRGTGDFAGQFSTVADRWLQAVRAMGASATPWQRPNMYHRAWNLSTMTPNDNGVREPEASGAIAWLQYHAYKETGEDRYRQGSEWALEYLDNESVNPSYELQLAYGALTAARMNAELGTTYDIEKIVNWCFGIGPLRSWGAIVGTWGGYDVSGLIGEVNGDNDYAFAMNTFEQIGALVPLVRYDDRFARAIGKWVLNAANAARLFYPAFLPVENQDSSGASWAATNDPASSVAYEAIRQSVSGHSPFATGDAVTGGWGQTNLALYGSSHVGILGAIIDTTNVPMILSLDLLATDYFHSPAYPSSLMYNPDSVDHLVSLNVGDSLCDVYDAVSNAIVATSVSGAVPVLIPAGGALVAVVLPAGGSVTYQDDAMLVNGVVADFSSGQIVQNYAPRIKALAATSTLATFGQFVPQYCTATDRDGDTLEYTWLCPSGSFAGIGASVTWTAPDTAGEYTILCTVADGEYQRVDSLRVQVVAAINHPPTISKLSAQPRKVSLGESSSLTCLAGDIDGDTLVLTWSADAGSLQGSGASVSWTAPMSAGNVIVRCLADDGHGGQVTDSIMMVVRDLTNAPVGTVLASYPFNNSASDVSGNGRHGAANNVVSVSDRSGSPQSAYSFNGTSSSIVVPNDAGLNSTNAVSAAFWMTVKAFYDREQYPISHGNYTNRWKVSISAQRLRWTVKTSSGIKDLDSEAPLALDSLYHVVVLYDGLGMEVYLNGVLDACASWSGALLTTTASLTMGQVLAGDNSVNFNGILDDVTLYDYPLLPQAIQQLFAGTTYVQDREDAVPRRMLALDQNYPNPFNSSTNIRFTVPPGSDRQTVLLEVSDLVGRIVAVLFEGTLPPGTHVIPWSAAGLPSGVYYYRLKTSGAVLTRPLLLVR